MRSLWFEELMRARDKSSLTDPVRATLVPCKGHGQDMHCRLHIHMYMLCVIMKHCNLHIQNMYCARTSLKLSLLRGPSCAGKRLHVMEVPLQACPTDPTYAR